MSSSRSAPGLAVVASVIAWARSASAVELPNDGDIARPCRPTVSCTADIAAPGSFEAEVGSYYASLGGDARLWSYPVLLKQTLTRLLQLQVGSNGYTRVSGSQGQPITHHVDNLLVGPKLHFLDQGDVAPSLALTALASVPAFAPGHDGAFLTGHASKDVGPLHADLNVGVDLWWAGAAGADAAAQPFGALAFSATPLPPLGVALEGYAFTTADPYASRDGGVRLAFTLTPRPWLVFDFGGDLGWFPSTHGHSLFVGMTVLPVVFWREPEQTHEDR